MITPLRRRHRWLAPAAFAGAAAIFVAALTVRPERFPGSSAMAATLPSVLGSDARLVLHASGRFQVALQGPLSGGSPGRVWLLPNEALDLPDLLVYALAEGPAGADLEGQALPAAARLLGPAAQLAPTSWPVTSLPAGLVLFSLGHQAVAASIDLR